MKRILNVLLCLIMLTGMMTFTASAASVVNIFNITITEPVVGEKPTFTASVPATASSYVKGVVWEGTLDANGCFMAGQDYTAYVTVGIKEGQDKIIKYVASTVKINGNLSQMKDISSDKKQAVIYYTFKSKSKQETVIKVEGLTKTAPKYSDFEWEVLRLVNIERAKEGLNSLSMHRTLQACCDIREIEINTVFDHKRPDGTYWDTVLPKDFSAPIWGENIAKGHTTPAAVVEAWMNSPGHRANILNGEYGYIGVGYNKNGNCWVQLFAGRKTVTSIKASTDKTEFTADAIIKEKLTLTTNDGYVSEMPLDFASMRQQDSVYYPRLPFTVTLPSYKKVDAVTAPAVQEDPARKYVEDDCALVTEMLSKLPAEYYTKDGIITFARTAIKYNSIVSYKAEPSITPATTTVNGAISGEIVITNGSQSKSLPFSYVLQKLPEQITEAKPSTENMGGEAGALFDMLIPINQVYASDMSPSSNYAAGKSIRFSIGTQFVDSSSMQSAMFKPMVKRSENQGKYIKLRYLGRFGELDTSITVDGMGLFDKTVYTKLMNGEPLGYNIMYPVTYNSIVVAVDLCDANGNFEKTFVPATLIYAVGENNDFITYTKYYKKSAALYFSKDNNLFAADADEQPNKRSLYINATHILPEDMNVVNNLLSTNASVVEAPYQFIAYPEITTAPQYDTNILLDDDEVITSEGTYIQIGTDGKNIDPVIKNKIENVVDYSRFVHYIKAGYTQRNLVTADGTLYGITDKHEKKVIATNVVKTTENYYMTKDGTVYEINGKKAADNCRDFAETYDASIFGVLKTDGTGWIGHTFKAGGQSYERGLVQVISDVKAVVTSGFITKKNEFYRWNVTTLYLGYDENAFSMGQFIEKVDHQFSVVKVCDNASRVFPYEYAAKYYAHDENNLAQSFHGFIWSEGGHLYGYGPKYHENLGDFPRLTSIFTVFESTDDGTFIGFTCDGDPYIRILAVYYCDYNRYHINLATKIVNGIIVPLEYLCTTQNGFRATDGITYTYDNDPLMPKTDRFKAVVSSNLGQVHRGTNMFQAYSTTTQTSIKLLPNIASWAYDNKKPLLLERMDGSVWMALVHPAHTSADMAARLGGYENSNAIQISPPTTKKKPLDDYIDVAALTSGAFTDVAGDAYYAAPVDWAVDKKITTGTSATTFSPDNTCTKAQILTFLWRAVGSPKATIANPFSDVAGTDYFYDAAIWAYEKGMVSGNVFEGNTPCTRASTVVYIWASVGKPAVAYAGNFTDVTAGDSFKDAVAWAVANGVTSGTSATTFSPESTCTRGQIVTFLYRALK